jgi:hypothetical protein
MIGRRHEAWRMGIARLVAVAGVLALGIGDARSESENVEAQGQPPAAAGSDPTTGNLRDLASRALGEDAILHAAAIQELRQCGPEAVKFLMRQRNLAKIIRRLRRR